MKTKTSLLIISLLIGSLTALHADESKTAVATSAKQTITGEVIDVTCYVDHGAKGAKHADCAKTCIGKGLPAAILSNGTLYMALAPDHGNASTLLEKLGGENVKVTGKVTQKNGASFIEIASVEKI